MNRKIVLVQCVSKKQNSPQMAKNLYISPLFLNASEYAEEISDEWFILSAKYGLVEPTEVLAPYDVTLKDMSAKMRREWAKRVFSDLRTHLRPTDTVVILAGVIYRRDLVTKIESFGCKVEIPMKSLRIGEQLRWLKLKLKDN